MTLRHIYRFGLMLLAALFFTVQSVSMSHATSYADAQHEHDGQICVLGIVSGHDDVIVIPDVPQEPHIEITTSVTDYTCRPYAAPRSRHSARAPPPRAPPSTL